MKAISLWQPWASAIACGVKQVETRSWYTAYRGPIAIHAAKKWNKELLETTLALITHSPEFYRGLRTLGLTRWDKMHLGAVVATAHLTDCIATEILRPTISPLERAFGNYSAGRWGWILTNIKPIAEPIPASGLRLLWEWNPPSDLVLSQ